MAMHSTAGPVTAPANVCELVRAHHAIRGLFFYAHSLQYLIKAIEEDGEPQGACEADSDYRNRFSDRGVSADFAEERLTQAYSDLKAAKAAITDPVKECFTQAFHEAALVGDNYYASWHIGAIEHTENLVKRIRMIGTGSRARWYLVSSIFSKNGGTLPRYDAICAMLEKELLAALKVAKSMAFDTAPMSHDTKTDTSKKKRRKLNAQAASCAMAFKNEKKLDDSQKLKPFVDNWAEKHGMSASSIYRNLMDNRDCLSD